MQLILSQAESGRHHVHLGDRLVTTSDNPVFSAARILLEEGVHWSVPLEVFLVGSRQPCLRTTVLDASRPPLHEADGGLGLQARPSNIFHHPR